ncbi:MAG: tripartite tricarboxylate transporter substrate binding protein [Betaproteobacteria bacterium]|nr:tripartite tricarboxylate transporter substrate binding protein [Betaproteobacteria bacterium]
MRTFALPIAASLAVAAWVASAALAQDYPTKPIRWIIPYSPGGATDITARTLSPHMSQTLGQQIVAENRAGGAAIPGFDLVAKAAPDGYTMLLANIAFAANPSLFKKLPFDVQKDFTPVSKVAVVPMVVSVHPSLPVKTLDDLIRLARKNPGKLNFGSAGNGSANQLTTEVFRSYTKVDMVHVPFKGGGPAVAALVGGQIDLLFATISSASHHIKDGRLRALALTYYKRSSTLPEVPTLQELGLKDYNYNEWQVVVVPASTPRPIVDRLNKAIVGALADPKVKARMAELGNEVEGTTPEEAAAFLKKEWALWPRIIKEAGIQVVN